MWHIAMPLAEAADWSLVWTAFGAATAAAGAIAARLGYRLRMLAEVG